MGYSKPFRVLSDEGVRMVRKTIANHEKYVKRNDRMRGGTLSGLHYMSKFNEDMIYDP